MTQQVREYSHEGLRSNPQNLCKSQTYVSSAVERVRTGRLLRLAGHQPSFRFNERLYQRGKMESNRAGCLCLSQNYMCAPVHIHHTLYILYVYIHIT